MRSRDLGVVLAAAVVLFAGCAHVSNPFWHTKASYTHLNKEVLRTVADEIEKAVKEGNKEPKIADRDGIVVNTPEILQLLRTRALRSQLVDEYRASGCACEKRDGLLYMLNSKEYRKTFKARARKHHEVLVIYENQDRWALYQGILQASKLPGGSLSAIQETFADARAAILGPGQKYVDDKGKTVTSTK